MKTLTQLNTCAQIDPGAPQWAIEKSLLIRQVPGMSDLLKDSVVRDEQGNPLLVFHGTTAIFDQFDMEKEGGPGDIGVFFTNAYGVSKSYAELPGHSGLPFNASGRTQGRVLAAHLNIRNPYCVTDRQWSAREGLTPKQAKENGFDGYIVVHHARADRFDAPAGKISTPKVLCTNYVAFYSEQIVPLGWEAHTPQMERMVGQIVSAEKKPGGPSM